MFISNLRIQNFKGFNGVHDFYFAKGLNIIHGNCGGGKTSLCQAIEFGLFGAISGPPGKQGYSQRDLASLVNVQHRKECEAEKKFYEFTVELQLVVDNDLHKIERSLYFHNENEVNESIYYPPDFRLELNRNIFHDEIIIDETILEQNGSLDAHLSVGKRMCRHLMCTLDHNVERKHGLVILDQALARFPQNMKVKLLDDLANRELEQILILESISEHDTSLIDDVSKEYMLGTTIQELKVAVDNFPFPASVLEDRISFLLDGVYISDSISFPENVYNHEYVVKITDATPNGGRFSEQLTKILF
jgi:hypothetical protein